MYKLGALSLGLCIWATLGCGQSPLPAITQTQQANFVNGGFESGDLTSWTLTTGLTPTTGIPVFPPTTVANLGLTAGGTNLTKAYQSATPESLIASGLTAADTLRYPKFGQWSAVINELGKNRNSNTLTQIMTTTQADVDSLDGNIHVRFALAPVLENPGHVANQQPYFFISIQNATKNTTLFESFNFSGQAGVPFKTAAASAQLQYTDWQLFDLAPGPVGLAIGDTVRADIIATGCAPGGHFGELYVDGFGTFIPGLTVVASTVQSANAGTDLVYTFVAKNGGTTGASNVVVTDVLPDNTTFIAATGATCTTPSVGQAGTVTCNLGTLNPSAGATFQITVHIAPTATGTISNGNYTIQGTGINALIGPLVQTTVTVAALYADLAITATSTNAAQDWGTPISYTVVVTNNGSTSVIAAPISNMLPAELTGVTWTCTGANNGVCGAANGSGALSTTANLPVGAAVTYKVSGTIVAGSGVGLINYLVRVATPTAITDPDTRNNSAVSVTNVGPVAALTIDKGTSSGTGTITSSPVGLACGPTCTTQAAKFLVGSAVTLTAVAQPGSTFTGWTGACADFGTAPQCTVTIDMAKNVSATFSLPSYPITTSVPNGHGTVTCTNPTIQGRDAMCTITPDSGYVVSVVRLDEADISSTVTSSGFTIPNVQGAHAVEVGFTKDVGNSCSTTGECHSGFCVGGVCCDTACDGACEVCTNPGQVGICGPACGSFACDTAASSCFTACTTDDQCTTGGTCADGTCLVPAAGQQFAVSGGGLSGCAYGEPKGASAPAGLALLGVLAFLARRRRLGWRAVA